jgi:prevent-host-death family protein
MSSQPKSISVGKFKLRCLSLLESVARTRQTIIVTKRGRPVAKVIPTETHNRQELLGTVKFHGNIVEPILGEWEIEQ